MEFDDFVVRVINAFPVGTTIQNPGGGTSLIVATKNLKISYRRGKSTMSVKLIDLFNVHEQFRGMLLTSNNLRVFKHEVFDSSARPAGHSCNCTMLFRIFETLQLSEPIKGAGVRGNPFSIKIHP